MEGDGTVPGGQEAELIEMMTALTGALISDCVYVISHMALGGFTVFM